MQTSQLETRVKEEFNMNLGEFIREKVEEGKLYNFEIARILNVRTPIIKKLRKIHKIKKPDRFRERFEKKYGKGSIDAFRKIIEDTYSTLADLGRHFGFSRENARILYKKIYGFPYTETRQEKRALRKRLKEKHKAKSKTKRPYFMTGIIERAKFLGFTLEIPVNGNNHNILVNGYKVNCKMASMGSSTDKNRFFSISPTKMENNDCDFFICVCQENGSDAHYIIPYDAMPKNGASIPVGPPSLHRKGSKYFQFRESWNFLEKGRNWEFGMSRKAKNNFKLFIAKK